MPKQCCAQPSPPLQSASPSFAIFFVSIVMERVGRPRGRCSKPSQSRPRTDVLKIIIVYGIRGDSGVNNASIVALFPFSADKETARAIIDASRGVSCTCGHLHEALVVFVIRVSGSLL
jgi:hypothetical protein